MYYVSFMFFISYQSISRKKEELAMKEQRRRQSKSSEVLMAELCSEEN